MPDRLITKEVCRLLAVSYQELKPVMKSLEDRLAREGTSLLWDRETVSLARRMLAELRTKKSYRETAEARNYAEAVEEIKKIGVTIRKVGERLERLSWKIQENPPTATGFIHTLPDPGLVLLTPIGVLLSPTDRFRWKASLPEALLEVEADTRPQAMRGLREILAATYQYLRQDPSKDPETWQLLVQLIRPNRVARVAESLEQAVGKLPGIEEG